MVDILPFKGLLYNQDKINDVSKVVSPPYDVIGPGLLKKLKEISPYNVTNLILPESLEEENKYVHAANILENWIKGQILVSDKKKSFYLIEVIFEEEGKQKSINGFIGLNKIEDYDSGKVLRHEDTLPKPKEDRLKLLEATKANFGLIYTVYRDNTDLVTDLIKENEPETSIKPYYDPRLCFNFRKISDEAAISLIIGMMKDKSVLIADGHHRYETSRIYSSRMKKEGLKASDYILTLFVNSKQKDISIYPTYRILKLKKSLDIDMLIDKSRKYFTFEKVLDHGLNEILYKEKQQGRMSFIIYPDKDNVHLARLKKELPRKGDLEDLDVYILHRYFIDEVIGSNNIEDISYTHREEELKKEVGLGSFDLGVMLNPPAIEQVESLSGKGLLMPQKSTYFYPKPCTGLVMYKF